MTLRHVAYVDSADEQLAFLLSRFGPQAAWSVVEQRLATGPDGVAVERAQLRTAEGAVEVEFRDADTPYVMTSDAAREDRSGIVDAVMERAATFAAENPPSHPGSLARFPVPIEHYEQAVAIPLPILAVDDSGSRGLFAPPRMAVVSWRTIEPIGVREFEGFDPANWPPARLGDWPVPSAARLTSEVLDASIQRFSACWKRVIDAWFAREDGPSEPDKDPLPSDADDALRLRALLDPPAMDSFYDSMNPRFGRWLVSHRT